MFFTSRRTRQRVSRTGSREAQRRRLHRDRRLTLEPLEERQLLAVDLVSAVSDPSLIGNTGNGYSDSMAAALSSDGRYVAFSSYATNLVAGDTNGYGDVFVKDMATGVTTRVSTDATGVQADGDSYQAGISADGRYVVFLSEATNLVADDTNGYGDVFVKDLVSGTVVRATTDANGVEADSSSYEASVSDDGRYVAFLSYASNLSAADTNTYTDAFVKDLQSGAIVCASANSAGVVADTGVYSVVLSGDGRYVAFASETALVGSETGLRNVYVKDLQTGETTLASAGVEDNCAADLGDISADGRYVAYQKREFWPDGDETEVAGTFVVDRATGVATLVPDSNDVFGEATLSNDGRYVVYEDDNYVYCVMDLQSGVATPVYDELLFTSGNTIYGPALSDDGRYVVLNTSAYNVIGSDMNDCSDVFRYDLEAQTVVAVSTRDLSIAGPFAANHGSYESVLSGDGRYVAFVSGASNLVAGDTNGLEDVFVTDLESGLVTRVNTSSSGGQASTYDGCGWWDKYSYGAAISDDGRYVAFESTASDLVDNDTNALCDVFVKDLVSGATTLVSSDSAGVPGNGTSYEASISADGRYVTFSSVATNLVRTPTVYTNVFVKDLQTGVTTLVSCDANGVAGNYASYESSISGDGRYVAFASSATNLTDTASLNANDVFVKDLQSGAVVLASVDASGVVGDASSNPMAISADGRYLIFTSEASNLVDGDTNGVFDIFCKDLTSGALTLVSSDSAGVAGNGMSYDAEISGDGRYVTFSSVATNLVGTPTPDTYPYVYVKDLLTGATTQVCVDVVSTLYSCDINSIDSASISGDGQYLTFTTYLNTLVAGDGNQESDVFRVANPALVTNHSPTDISLSNASVAENRVTGTLVGTLTAVDADAGDTFTYTLLDSAGGRFKIVGDQLVVADGTLLDYEATTSHVITVQVADTGGLTYDEQFTIDVTDVHDFDSVAVYDPSTSMFYLRGENASGAADYAFGYGVANAGWTTLVGDWDGNGTSDAGLFDPATSTFYLTDAYQTGVAKYTFGYGVPDAGWIPLVGDWDGNGTSGVGLFDPTTSTFYLTDTLATGVAEYTFGYGVPDAGWEPIVGDWNGTGSTGVGLYDPQNSGFYLTATLATGYAEYTFGYGVPDAGWTPIVGDWNGNGTTGVGLYDPAGSTFYLTDTLATGCAENTFAYGVPGGGWTPLVGDWNGDRAAGVGLYDAAGTTFYLSSALQTGVAEHTVQIAEANSGCVPLVGCWTETPAAAAVDAVDLADVAAGELELLSTSSLDSATAIDQALAEL